MMHVRALGLLRWALAPCCGSAAWRTRSHIGGTICAGLEWRAVFVMNWNTGICPSVFNSNSVTQQMAEGLLARDLARSQDKPNDVLAQWAQENRLDWHAAEDGDEIASQAHTLLTRVKSKQHAEVR
jgi:hypothetical protein